MRPAVVDVLQLLRSSRFDTTSESVFQTGVQQVLVAANVQHERERELGPGDRIDFLIEGGIGVELKIKGAQNDVMRQLGRYARHPEVKALILATTRVQLVGMPRALSGKPVFVHLQGGIG